MSPVVNPVLPGPPQNHGDRGLTPCQGMAGFPVKGIFKHQLDNRVSVWEWISSQVKTFKKKAGHECLHKMSVKFASVNKRQGPAGSNWRGRAAQRMCGYNKNILS